MSKNKFLVALPFFFIFLLGISFWWSHDVRQGLNEQKLGKLRHHHRHLAFTKLKKPLDVEIELVDKDIEKNQPFTLRAKIRAHRALPNAHFEWKIDAVTEILTGENQGRLQDLKPGDEEVFEITLRSSANFGSKVYLNVYGFNGETKLGATGFFNSARHMDLPSSMSREQKPKFRLSPDRVIY